MHRLILGIVIAASPLLGCPDGRDGRTEEEGAGTTLSPRQPEVVATRTERQGPRPKTSRTQATTVLKNSKNLAHIKRARELVTKVAGAITVVVATSGKLPLDLKDLVSDEFIDASELLDPWGQALTLTRLKAKGHSHKVCSAGPDRRANTTDDVCARD